eukprot:13123311-Alexandrium_andersonii.AAC.1
MPAHGCRCCVATIAQSTRCAWLRTREAARARSARARAEVEHAGAAPALSRSQRPVLQGCRP